MTNKATEDKASTDVAGQVDPLVMRKHTLAKPGDHVFYDGKEGKVLALSHIFNGTPTLALEDVDDPEMTCIAKEADCITMESWWYGSARSVSGIQY